MRHEYRHRSDVGKLVSDISYYVKEAWPRCPHDRILSGDAPSDDTIAYWKDITAVCVNSLRWCISNIPYAFLSSFKNFYNRKVGEAVSGYIARHVLWHLKEHLCGHAMSTLVDENTLFSEHIHIAFGNSINGKKLEDVASQTLFRYLYSNEIQTWHHNVSRCQCGMHGENPDYDKYALMWDCSSYGRQFPREK